jgi:hypothetical protein
MNRPLNFSTLIRDMSSGFQMPGVSFLQHGELVADRFSDLLGDRQMTWRLPIWFLSYRDQIVTRIMPDIETIKAYQVYHDCSKPYCREVDDSGRAHYPDHSKVSAEIWRSLGGSERIGSLIARDMDCHLLRPAGATEFAKRADSLILLLTALCEVHANAEMFGGIQSDSFKIKWKRLDKIGEIILREQFTFGRGIV